MEIREIEPSEYADAGTVTADAYREFQSKVNPEADYEAYLAEIADIASRAPRTTILVAVDRGEIVGSTTLEITGRIHADTPPPDDDEIHIRMLGVAPAARGHGVGKALMEATLALAAELGRTRITLHTTDLMVTARHMYEAMGFSLEPGKVEMPSGICLFAYTLDTAPVADDPRR